METKILKAILSLNDRLASIEYILKIIANNNQQVVSPGTTKVYFPLQMTDYQPPQRP